MTDWMIWALPFVQIAGALVIASRFSWRAHPSLIAYLATECLWQLFPLFGISATKWALPVQLVVRAAVVFEIAVFARLSVPPEWRGRMVAAGMIACAFAVNGGGYTAMQRFYLFREYYMLMLCAGLCGLTLWRFRYPMIECKRHRVYRLGMTAWLAVFTISGTFIKGGIAYHFLPYTRESWNIANTWTYAATLTIVPWMALSMAGGWSRVPADVVRSFWLVVRDARARTGEGEGEVKGRMAA